MNRKTANMHSICHREAYNPKAKNGRSSGDINEICNQNERKGAIPSDDPRDLLACNRTSLFGQPASRIGHVSTVSVSRDGHVVILPPALEMIPGRADETQFSGLVVNGSLKLELEWVSMGILNIGPHQKYLLHAPWECHHPGSLHSSSCFHGVI